MAKKQYGNIADDLFTENAGTKENKTYKEPEHSIKKVGRPRSKDINSNDKVKRTSIYFKEDMLYDIDLYALNNKMDRSEAIRYMISSFMENNR